MRPISSLQGKKELYFHSAQEVARKYVERVFEILQSQYAIVQGPARFWDQENLWYIMNACVIMHNIWITLFL